MWTDLERPPLRVASLRRGLLAPDGPYWALDVVEETGSTNTDLVELARAGAADRTVLVAEHQGSGRGRHGRTWLSPPRAGLSFSVLLRPDGVPSSRWAWLPLLAGVALADAVAAVAAVPVALKWPNDLLAGSGLRKCAGILAEVAEVAAGPAVVVGFGLNVSQRADELPPQATSLAVENAACADRDPLLRAVLRELSAIEARWRQSCGDPVASGLHEAYLRLCATVGQRVRVALPAGAELTGLATGVDSDGRLQVREDCGSEHAVSAGDVLHVRRTPQ